MQGPHAILLIEDDTAVASSLKEALETEGYRVTWTKTGQEGVRLAQAQPPHLIILDVRLPDGSGPLNGLLQETAELFASRAEQVDCRFELNMIAEPLLVQGRPLRLQQLVHNLLDNALKFTPAGGEVTVSLGRENRFACLSITDSGIGIPAEDSPHLFGRFHRGRNATDYPGSGLGLAIVQAIVDGHNGRIAIQSTPPGPQVIMHLPLAA